MALESRRFAARAMRALAGGLRGSCILLLVLAAAGCQRAQSDLAPRQLLEKGWGHFRLEEFSEAKSAFEAALEKVAAPEATSDESGDGADKNTLRLNATYGLALIASLARPGEAGAASRQLFEQVIALDSSSSRELAAWAALAIVREAHLPPTADTPIDTRAIREAYTRVMEQYPKAPAAEEALLYRTAVLAGTLDPADARQTIADVSAYVAHHPQARLRTALLALQSEAHRTLGEYRQSLATAIASVEAKEPDPANPRQNNILEYYRIGMMAQFDVGDFATARTYYGKFLEEYPRDQRAFAVRLLLGHLEKTEAALRAGGPVPELSALVRERTAREVGHALEAFDRRLKPELRAAGDVP